MFTQVKSHYTLRNTGFNTIISTDSPIICLSDIHGDIDALIICLRDCANVIKKKKGIEYNNNKRDPDLEKYLGVNLNDNNPYIDDLHYEWSGGSSYIVIIGDILDPVRGNFNTEHVYPQVEIKILRFINKISSYAEKVGGKVIKLCGNHELANFIKSGLEIKAYMSDSDIKNENYYNGLSRTDYFKLGNPGFKLFQEGGIGFGVLINNNFFVHGGLTADYDIEIFILINKLINIDWVEYGEKYRKAHDTLKDEKKNITIEEFSNLNELIKRYDHQHNQLYYLTNSETSPLWTREFNYNNNIPIFLDKEEKEKKEKAPSIIATFFNYFMGGIFNKTDNTKQIKDDKKQINDETPKPEVLLDKYFKILFRNDKYKKYDIDEYRLIIGHSGQHGSILKYENATFSHVEDSNKKTIKYTNKEIYNGTGDFDNNLLFGISVAYIQDLGLKNPRLIRVDYNLSRGFDILDSALSKYCKNQELLKNNVKNIIKILYEARSPQVCIIENNNKLSIVKSTLKNTKINLPRKNFLGTGTDNKSKIYELILKHVNNCITEQQVNNMLNEETKDSAYYDKYMKYKNKYMKLKN
jgi:hypothetical protein